MTDRIKQEFIDSPASNIDLFFGRPTNLFQKDLSKEQLPLLHYRMKIEDPLSWCQPFQWNDINEIDIERERKELPLPSLSSSRDEFRTEKRR